MTNDTHVGWVARLCTRWIETGEQLESPWETARRSLRAGTQRNPRRGPRSQRLPASQRAAAPGFLPLQKYMEFDINTSVQQWILYAQTFVRFLCLHWKPFINIDPTHSLGTCGLKWAFQAVQINSVAPLLGQTATWCLCCLPFRSLCHHFEVPFASQSSGNALVNIIMTSMMIEIQGWFLSSPFLDPKLQEQSLLAPEKWLCDIPPTTPWPSSLSAGGWLGFHAGVSHSSVGCECPRLFLWWRLLL